MNSCYSVNFLSDTKGRSVICSLFIAVSLACCVYFISSEWLHKDVLKLSMGFGLDNATRQHAEAVKLEVSSMDAQINVTRESVHTVQTHQKKCDEKCTPGGSESLPQGIVSAFSNLEMLPLWGPLSGDTKSKHKMGLLAIAVGISQKILVNKIVKKFLDSDFVVMLFHYDGVVDGWHELGWSDRVIHISAKNQTKWWFAKRFLHPDIISEYEYIFLWDEDLGVENFHPQRYLSIIKEEGLEISQPALDPRKSAVYHPITARKQGARIHRRYFKYKGSGLCDGNSAAPPCVGWVELMAPVFSRAAWRCAWYMIQNDLIHAWGLDLQLGYCAQGDRTAKVGVVDEEYIIHFGLPTLGGFSDHHKRIAELSENSSNSKALSDSESLTVEMYRINNRSAVRRRSHDEMMVFKQRWKDAVEKDECWVDPFGKTATIR